MRGSFLLDTNIVIALFRGDQSVQDRLGDADVFVPGIVLGELFYGAYVSARSKEGLTQISEFAEASVVLFCDAETAQAYGRIKFDLRKKGRPIPENDVWIAALAAQHQLTLATRDRHFDEVDVLTVEAW